MGSCRPPILFLCSLPGRTVCGVLMWLRGQFGDVGQTVMGWKGRQRTIVKCSPFSGISERVVAGLKLLLPFSTINKGSSTRQTDRRVLESLTFSHWTYFRTFVLLKKELNLTPVECQAKFSALVPPTFESDLFSLILGKITVKMLFQHRTNNYNCITWRKTVQCPCPANEIGALEFVTPQWSIPEMSRMTAFLRFPRAAAWPSCSCTSASAKTAKCETVATSGLGNRLLKTRWFVDDEGLSLRTITHWLPCFVFFFSFGPWIAAHDSCQSRRQSMVLLRSIAPTHGSQVFILVFDVPSPKCFAQLGDRHSCQVSNIGSVVEKRKGKNTCGRSPSSRSSQKMFGDGEEFSKRPPRHRRNQKPQRLKVWRQILQKRGKQKKTLRNGHNSGKKRDNFELRTKSSLESLAQNILEWPSPSHARNLSFPHDGYIRHTATEMIILMTDISVTWHSTG